MKSDTKTLLQKFECPQGTPLGGDFATFDYGKGSFIWSENKNKKYFDATSFFSVANLGHNPSYLRDLLYQQKDELIHAMGDVYPTSQKAVLLEKLCHLFEMDKAQLCITGTDAVEFALKTIELKKKNPTFLSFENSYHGLGFGALSVTNYPGFNLFSTPYKSIVAPYPSPENKEAFLSFFKKMQKNAIDAVIIEPVLGRGGVIYPFEGALEFLRELTHKQQIPLIFDEIFCGLYRTGDLRGTTVNCDLLLIGKALSNGLPLSVVLGTKELMDLWPLNEGEALHTGTFTGHGLSIRAALATLSEYEQFTQKNLQENQQYLARKMKDVNGEGKGFFYRIPVPNALEAMKKLFKEQIVILPADVDLKYLGYYPPLTTTPKEHDFFFETFKKLKLHDAR